jgi:hypothetical protein
MNRVANDTNARESMNVKELIRWQRALDVMAGCFMLLST